MKPPGPNSPDQRFDANGNPITPEQAHPSPNRPTGNPPTSTTPILVTPGVPGLPAYPTTIPAVDPIMDFLFGIP